MIRKTMIKTLTLGLLLTTTILGGCAKTSSTSGEVIKIGISQIIEHESLDSTRKGFIDALADNGFKDGEKIKIDFQNAQGDMSITQTIAQNFVSQKKDLILAIATPSAQAAYNLTKDIPILVTAVTDPVKAGLVNSLDKSGTNVAGTTDAAPLDKQFELLKKLVPTAKKVGIMYNTSEVNSESDIEQAKKLAPKYGLEIITTGISSVNDISQTLEALIPKIDVLYAPTDNMVASSMPLISTKCTEKKIPIIGAVIGEVEGGALATEGIDYYKLGYQTGEAAIEIINGKKPQDMPITTLKDTQLVINMDSAKKLNINIPEDLMEKATIIGGGK
ncbi:ABC transporter substrate-binding protein [uncultured Clostridium sp.]|uniref:ABC transporter substrate-binding protein n=1 Tax=uncultured Clostridium sp. TaxID=59620 RepID=UPI0028E5DA5D|nr:ABC transporter substrate-binding protein [uncultured Clostridium sp.]